MASGQVTINAAVPYLGELFQTSKRPNTHLKMLGGIQGGLIEASAREFPTGVFFDLRTPAQPAILEGAAAPTAQHRAFTQSTNVIQIFHEAVDLSYLAQSDRSVSGIVPIPQAAAHGRMQNPRDASFQVMAALETIAQDANYSFLRGTYANPANPSSTALKTRGLHTAIATNQVDKSGEATPTAATYKSWVELLVKTVIQTNGYNPDDTWTLLCGVNEFNNVQAAYESTYQVPQDRTVGGLKLRQIFTRFGIINLALEPDMPDVYVDLINYGVCGIVGLPVPNKGILFEEELLRTGSSDKTQIYGQMGMAHGPEYCHGWLKLPAVTL
jgi:hypothetical protein